MAQGGNPAPQVQVQQPPLRRLDHFPNKFHGAKNEDACGHWLEMEDFWQAQNIPAQNRIDNFKLSLSGKARLWFEGKNFANIQELKTAFVNHYAGVRERNATRAKLKQEKLKPGETVDEFLTRLQPMLQALNYDDAQKIDLLNDCLSEEMLFEVNMLNPGNLQEFVNAAQRYLDLSASKTKKAVEFNITMQNSKFDTITEKLDNLCLVLHSMNHRGRSVDRRDRGSRYRSQSNDSSQRSNSRSRSDRYKSPGYRDSRFRRSNQSNYRRDSRSQSPRYTDRSKSPRHRRQDSNERLTCNYCKKPGHVWRKCFKLDQDMKDSNNQSN